MDSQHGSGVHHVCIDGLRFKACNGIELLDCRSTETCKSPENSTLDLCDLCVFHGINQCVLGLGGMVLQLLCGIFLAEGGNLVEIHFEVVSHLLGKFILRSS